MEINDKNLNEYLNNFSTPILQTLCRYKQISFDATKQNIINKIMEVLTKCEIETIIETNKYKKYIIICKDENDITHTFFTNTKNPKNFSNKYCDYCEDFTYQISYDNLFYDSSINNMTDYHKYLNDFTVTKLKIICEYKKICNRGNKKEIMDNIINKITEIEFKNIIVEVMKKKYLIYCTDEKQNMNCHFTDKESKSSYCDICKINCIQDQHNNLFYDPSYIIIKLPIDKHTVIPQPTITETSTMASKKPKQKIPSNIRNIVWNQYIGEKNKNGKCLCCSSENISFANFHCGHIVSEKNGGTLTVDNLRPICMNCNLSIGTKNMEEFMKQFGIREPDNWNGKNKVINVMPYEEMKQIVWIKYVCNGTNKKCYVCSDIDLTKSTMEYDYLISNDNDIENIRPTCNDCHKLLKNMGIMEFFKLYEINTI